MGFFRTMLTHLFGGTGESEGEILWATIECDRCQEQITIRINKRTDVQSEYREPGDPGPWYSLHKEVMGNNCFALIHLSLEFDQQREVIHQHVTGGKLLALQSTKPDAV